MAMDNTQTTNQHVNFFIYSHVISEERVWSERASYISFKTTLTSMNTHHTHKNT